MHNHVPLSATKPSLIGHVYSHGSASAAYFQSINSDSEKLNGADIADIAHYLCMLHGRHPGIVDHAATKTVDDAARQWFVEAMDGFTAERAFLTKLTVAAGPCSGVGCDDQSNAAILGQRKALEMIAQSERNGCALGAVLALILEWHAIRPILDRIALRLEVEPRATILPTTEATLALGDITAKSKAVERAIYFGTDQLLAQHRGLWDLLGARHRLRAA